MAANRHQTHAASHLEEFVFRELNAVILRLEVEVVNDDFVLGLDCDFVWVKHFDLDCVLSCYESWVICVKLVFFKAIRAVIFLNPAEFLVGN